MITTIFIGDRVVNRTDFINTVFSNLEIIDEKQDKESDASSKFTLGKSPRPLHKLVTVDAHGNVVEPENKQQPIVVDDSSCVNTIFTKTVSPIYEQQPVAKAKSSKSDITTKISNLFSSDKKQVVCPSKVQVKLISISNMYVDSPIFRKYALDKMLESEMIFLFYDHRIADSFRHIIDLYKEFNTNRMMLGGAVQYPRVVMMVDTADDKNDDVHIRYVRSMRGQRSSDSPVDVNTKDEFSIRSDIADQLHKIMGVSDDNIHNITYNGAIDLQHMYQMIRTFVGSIIQKRPIR